MYSTIRNKKFNNYKDIHKDIDSLIQSVNEGVIKKRYNQKDGVGKSKYVISYHDGKKKHKDGSDFFDIQIFKRKQKKIKKKIKGIDDLIKKMVLTLYINLDTNMDSMNH